MPSTSALRDRHLPHSEYDSLGREVKDSTQSDSGFPRAKPPCHHSYQGVINNRVELPSDVHLEVLDRRQRRKRVAIGAFGGERVEGVGGAEDPPAERDLLAGQPVRISGPVPVLVVVRDVVERSLDVVERREDVEPDPHVSFTCWNSSAVSAPAC